MDEAMAPPLKRRKLTSSSSEAVAPLDNSTLSPETHIGHAGKHAHTHSPQAPPRTESDQHDDWTPRKQQPVVGGIADFKVLVPRQGTIASSATATYESTASLAIQSAISYIATSDSVSASLSISISASIPVASVPAGVTTSPTTNASNASPSRGTSSISSSTNSTSGNDRSTSSTSSTSSSAASNGMPTTTPPANVTTSAMIFIGDSSTTTSKTILTVGNNSSTSTNTGLFYFASLSDGGTSTLSRSSDSYITTLQDGEVFTIPALSDITTSTSISSSRTSSNTATSTGTQTSTENGQQSSVTAAPTYGGAGAAGSGSQTSSSPPTSTTETGTGGDGVSSTPPAGTIAGGVVGGAAGLAVLLLIAMLFVRWYRRKNQMQSLPAEGEASRGVDGPSDPSGPSGPGMAERAGLVPIMAAVPGLFRHQNRSAETGPSERGFTRVSGRKLPSAFSEGMSSEGVREPQLGGPSQVTPGMPLSNSPPDERNLSSTSFYNDAEDPFRGEGEGPRRRSPEEMMMMSPGPQRQPQVHHGGPYVMSPASAERPGATGTFGRSDTPSSLRNSRFTEDM